ncbi:hypothetical protein Lser_V15G38358 [Lactuca serriola]
MGDIKHHNIITLYGHNAKWKLRRHSWLVERNKHVDISAVKLTELDDYSSEYSLLDPLPMRVTKSRVLSNRPLTELSSVVKLDD